MDAIEVTFEETTVTTNRVYLHEDRRAGLARMFGPGPYSSEQLAEYLEEEQVIYFDTDEADNVAFSVTERAITEAKVTS